MTSLRGRRAIFAETGRALTASRVPSRCSVERRWDRRAQVCIKRWCVARVSTICVSDHLRLRSLAGCFLCLSSDDVNLEKKKRIKKFPPRDVTVVFPTKQESARRFRRKACASYNATCVITRVTRGLRRRLACDCGGEGAGLRLLCCLLCSACFAVCCAVCFVALALLLGAGGRERSE